MSDELTRQLELLPILLGSHIVVATTALLSGVLLSLPLGLVAARSSSWSWFVLAAAGVVQTIPGLALLALMVPLLDSFGFWPTIVALVLYSMLPVLRNTVTAITTLDPSVLEAARGVGMTNAQILRKVELPLALPLIVAGIRTAAVWVVGMATLSTPVGQPSLGNYIFAGLQTQNWTAVLVGCAAAACLALAIDWLLAGVQRGLTERSRTTVLVAVLGLVVLLIGGGSGAARSAASRGDVAQSPSSQAKSLATAASETGEDRRATERKPVTRSLRIGAKTFTEQYILARVIERRLRAAGFATERMESLGSTVAFDALRAGRIDVYVDYTGTIYSNYMKRSEARPPWQVEAVTAEWLASQHGIRQVGGLGFENAYALAVTPAVRARLSEATISGLAPVSVSMQLGGDYEFFERPEWQQLRQAYGLRFRRTISFDSTFMYDALQDGVVDVIAAFSSDGRIAAYDLVVLDDPKHALPPYDAVLLVAPDLADDPAVISALSSLVGSIAVQDMREANWMVDRAEKKRSLHEAAAWLDARP